MAGVSWGMTHNPTDDSLRPFRQSVEGTWEPGTGSERQGEDKGRRWHPGPMERGRNIRLGIQFGDKSQGEQIL